MKYLNNYLTILLLSFFILQSCKMVRVRKTESNDTIPKHVTFIIDSKKLNENRVINVWLPDNYEKSNDSLAVVYMPDGGIEEDFPHVANTIEKLIKDKKIEPVILVGIENIQRRKDLTPITQNEEDKKVAAVVGGSVNFRNFINDELFSEVQKRFRTKNHKTIIGESLAGLFITETFLERPEMFDAYIAIDPSLWWNDQYAVKTAPQNLAKFSAKPIKYWFAASDAGDINANTVQLENVLKNTTLPQLKWSYSSEPNENHGSIYRATKEKALIWSLGK